MTAGSMMATNAYGLKRSALDAITKRTVRQRCHFGCVVCGSFVIQYHHFDPPFASALQHRASGITLLCGGCHDKVTRRVWSDEKVRQANQSPKAANGGAREHLDLAPPLTVVLGTMIFKSIGPLITIGSDCLLEILSTEDGAALNARISDEFGAPALTILENELVFCADAWDVEAIGNRLVVRRNAREVILDVRLYPPHAIHVRAVNFALHGWMFKTDHNGRIQVVHEGGGGLHMSVDTATIHGGPMLLKAGGGWEMRGGFALVPYPAARFVRLAKSGSLTRLLWELTQQDTVHVAPSSSSPGKWALKYGRGSEIAQYEARNDALSEGHRFIKAHRDMRLVVHGLQDDRPNFFFGADS